MKQQYLRLFSFLIGITFIVSGVIFTLVNDYKVKRNEKIKNEAAIADEIGEVYKTFYSKEKDLSIYRDELLQNISDFAVFYTEMPSGYKKIMPQIQEYENMIVEIEDISSYLSSKCKKRYSFLEANDKCDGYYKILEKTINVFIGDIEYFNSRIKDYNDWTEVENESLIKEKTYSKLDEYKIKKYTDYVDLNGDGTYLGMNNE